ncbi:hypothetical protein GOBAR_AA13074 [Gossypium barbadense]|uniref:Uncharacterized protein n=1 Tax=Gossypium barbadense TaxID=3634 RepID=A0A2P5XW48_GOSBA|nr:hypothetical protein GOBAR_AA13074 [Gossypium barbadense]
MAKNLEGSCESIFGRLNVIATTLHGSICTTPSIYCLQLGLLGYLILFALYACILCITVTVGVELVNVYSSNTDIASSSGKEIHDLWAFYLHAALLRQGFTHYKKFSTTTSHRSLGRVSVLMWLIILSDQLLIIALVSYCLTN